MKLGRMAVDIFVSVDPLFLFLFSRHLYPTDRHVAQSPCQEHGESCLPEPVLNLFDGP